MYGSMGYIDHKDKDVLVPRFRSTMADKLKEEYYSPPPKLGNWEGFKIFLWNSETKQFLGRTAGSWAKILLFYCCFYACLIGFFSAMLAIFYQTLDMKVPKWQLDSSLIGSNPGLGFRPMPPESHVESTLVWFKKTDSQNLNIWINKIDEFLQPYRNVSVGGNVVTCNYNNPPPEGKVCSVDINEWEPCTKEKGYSYNRGTPCIFLKLNKIFNWMPQYYTGVGELPEKMPQDLKNHIQAEHLNDQASLNTVWVSCEGENPADVENIGSIQYFPKRGFPGYFFPYKNQEGYLSPVIAIWFEAPTTGVLVNIECKAWAKNIMHDRMERRGSVHFELMVD
ncbi:sodium/potassium-transporting ATPase subunit beta-2-like isoform X2 [Homalodisca vitripennis]|uniref:sodium/potassium-transporting ATPase subunit beta-2-like isoform X2 n=1 Tax=Homalodisca vitripennis TaxID=197043 RepID=UPI001EEB6A7A|nr:sodium/potassium-transporting ATPase subunit beta-2-like isoform X2 [Homalodisca vitripennis]